MKYEDLTPTLSFQRGPSKHSPRLSKISDKLVKALKSEGCARFLSFRSNQA